MKRNMDLVRLILLKIEEDHISPPLFDLTIDGYKLAAIAYHCKILHEAGLISDYKAHYADGDIYTFGVGGLTWEGNDFLDKIRDNSQWGKIKKVIEQKGLPLIIETVKVIATAYVKAAADGAANSIIL